MYQKKIKNKGLGDGSVGRVLAKQTWGPQFDPQNPDILVTPEQLVHPCKPSTRRGWDKRMLGTDWLAGLAQLMSSGFIQQEASFSNEQGRVDGFNLVADLFGQSWLLWAHECTDEEGAYKTPPPAKELPQLMSARGGKNSFFQKCGPLVGCPCLSSHSQHPSDYGLMDNI